MDFWDESILQRLKTERPLNFSTINNEEEEELSSSRRKIIRDPMSHRIIEKRRRDRMNNCLADLSRLIPTTYLKKGRGRIEKTEIIEMAIKHLKHLEAHSCQDPNNCEVNKNAEVERLRQYNLGYQECVSETIRFLVETEGMYPREGVCLRLITHLHQHYDKIGKGYYPQGVTTTRFMPSDASNLRMEVDLPLCPELTKDVIHIKRSPSPYTNEQQDKEEYLHKDSTTDHGCNGGSSQLREMLQNPGLPLERLRSNSTSSTQSTSYISSSIPASSLYSVAYLSSKGEEVYKFKNNIKERFHADIENETHSNNQSENDEVERYQDRSKYIPIPICAGLSRTQKCPVNENHTGSLTRPGATANELCVKISDRKDAISANGIWDSQIDSGSSNCSTNSSPNARSTCSTSGYSTEGLFTPKNAKGQWPVTLPYSPMTEPVPLDRSTSPTKPNPVPVFALHPKGSFYIPLTLDSAIIAPYFNALDETVPILHPISISVNFCNPIKLVESSRDVWTSRDFAPLSNRCGGNIRRERSSSLVLPLNPLTNKATVVM